MRVPMLAWCPNVISKGHVIRQMVQNIDIGPTVLEMAGLETPATMDGQSFLPLLQEKAVQWRDAVFYEYYWEWNFPHTPTVHGIRTDKYKYIHYHGVWEIDELYDLENDPNEMVNLINEKKHQERIKSLKKQVFDWLGETGGMFIPLRRSINFRAADRDPDKM